MEDHEDITTDEARAGQTGQGLRYVLGASLFIILLIMVIVLVLNAA